MALRDFPESDWRIFRKLRKVALERFCERALNELRAMTVEVPSSHHQRYLEVFKLVDKRDDELARTFNDPRRSTALIQLRLIRAYGLITDDEMACFSADTQAAVRLFAPTVNKAAADKDAQR